MAGIGFVLRKLTRQDNLLGVIQGFAHSALASNGPWLFTIIALATLALFTGRVGGLEALAEFRIIVIYNFAFSLVLSGPMLMVVTRSLADLIYEKSVETAPGMMLGGLAVVVLVQGPVAVAFYAGFADLDVATTCAAVSNFILVGCLWLVSVFLSALKDYRSISGAFAAGMAIAVVAGALLAGPGGAAGMLAGFNVGLAVVFFSLVAKILAEYPYRSQEPFAFLARFRRYWVLALSGLVYNLAIWVDKWIMWFSPQAETAPSRLVSYPHYDTAMFLAYLSITPAMAAFLVVVETRFFESYLAFYRDLQRHASFRRIQENHQRLLQTLVDGVRNLIVIQGSICVLVILTAPAMFSALKIDFLEIGMFRLGVFGSFFHVLVLILTIVLSYFDFRRPVLILQCVFLLTNAGFTFASMQLGFAYYGYGYFLSALCTFVVAYLLTYHYVGDLPYQSFVRNNRTVRPQGI